MLIITASVFSFAGSRSKFLAVKDISAVLIDERLGLMREWFLVNEREGNTLPYLYFPEKDELTDDNNIIRQLLTTQGIFALAKQHDDRELFEVGVNNLTAVFRKYYKFEEATGFGFFAGEKDVKLGGAALGIVAILEGGLAENYSNELAALARFVEAMQQPDGSFQTFYRPANFTSNDKFYSGEALLAATRLFEFSGDQKWLTFVARSFSLYRVKIKNNFLPQYVPWHTMAYAEMFAATGEQKYADFVFWMNDKLIDEMLDKNPNDPRDLGCFYNATKNAEYGPPHSASTSVYVEGIGYAHSLANTVGDQIRLAKYREAIILGARSLLELQYTPQDSSGFAHPEKIMGAIRRTIDHDEIRIDQTGHSANALLEAVKILTEYSA